MHAKDPIASCPQCGGHEFWPSRKKVWERLCGPLLPYRPFRCRACLTRYRLNEPWAKPALGIAFAVLAAGLLIIALIAKLPGEEPEPNPLQDLLDTAVQASAPKAEPSPEAAAQPETGSAPEAVAAEPGQPAVAPEPAATNPEPTAKAVERPAAAKPAPEAESAPEATPEPAAVPAPAPEAGSVVPETGAAEAAPASEAPAPEASAPTHPEKVSADVSPDVSEGDADTPASFSLNISVPPAAPTAPASPSGGTQ